MDRDLFDYASDAHPSRNEPLASRMRPKDFKDFWGQRDKAGPQSPLRKWIESDQVPSIILWGPPGCGKTTLARMISTKTSAGFISMSAVQSGVKAIKESAEKADFFRKTHGKSTILFVDEIHRFNKSQQDALLPYVEDGTFTLIGATTENPSFEINAALLSRTRVIILEALQPSDMEKLLKKALSDRERGLAGALNLDDGVISWLAENSDGDARKALTQLENLHRSWDSNEILSLEEALKLLSRNPLPYDKDGEEHYNVVSAFIKSLRDSDADAGLYYLARMLEGGEDPLFICRRLVVLASEDIGNAAPNALLIALGAKDAVHFVGMPEARINLAQAVTYLAKAPKNNASYVGIEKALADVREHGALPVPHHLRNAVTGLMKNAGYGKGYRYVHDDPSAADEQEHLPDKLKGKLYYQFKKD